MSESRLEIVRRRYAATPRELDDQLGQLARGDRGCAWLGVSGAGVLITVVVALVSLTGAVEFTWAYVGLAVWIGGTAMGARAQAASEKSRRIALAEAPLFTARVVLADPHLLVEGRRAGRALVVFAAGQPEGDGLVELAREVRTHEDRELATIRADRFTPGIRTTAEFGLGDDTTRLGWIAIDPLRLQGSKLDDAHAELVLIVDDARDLIEHV